MVDTEQQEQVEVEESVQEPMIGRLKELAARNAVVQVGGRNFVLYIGLLDLIHEEDGFAGIETEVTQLPDDSNNWTAMFKATVTTAKGTFTGHGDANEGNVGKMVAPAYIRMAETRAKSRALRDALNVGVTALEELGDTSNQPPAQSYRTNGAAPRPAQAPRQQGTRQLMDDLERSAGMQTTTAQRTGYNQPQGEDRPKQLGPNASSQPISDPQKNFLAKLGYTGDVDGLSRADASALIEKLKSQQSGGSFR